MSRPKVRPSPTESRTLSPKWLRHSTTWSMPFSRSSRNWCQRNGSPLISTRDLGMSRSRGAGVWWPVHLPGWRRPTTWAKRARNALALPEEERLRNLRQVRWIAYTRAREILGRFEDLLLYPPMHRMPCLLVVGETNNGKTAIVHRFERLHPADDNPMGNSIRVPVLTVQAPPVPEENRFYASILDALGSPYRANESAARRQIQVLHVLRAAGLRMLIIDEVHHIIAGHIGKQRIFLNVLKYLASPTNYAFR